MKWSPGISFYQRYPKITIKNTPNVTKGAKKCPKGVFDGTKVKNLENCDLCKACESASNKDIKIDGEPGKFIFTIESWGQLEPKTILVESCKIVKEQLKELKI